VLVQLSLRLPNARSIGGIGEPRRASHLAAKQQRNCFGVDDDEPVLATAKETVADPGLWGPVRKRFRSLGVSDRLIFYSLILLCQGNYGIQLAAHRCEQLAANLREIIDAKAVEKLPY